MVRHVCFLLFLYRQFDDMYLIPPVFSPFLFCHYCEESFVKECLLSDACL